MCQCMGQLDHGQDEAWQDQPVCRDSLPMQSRGLLLIVTMQHECDGGEVPF